MWEQQSTARIWVETGLHNDLSITHLGQDLLAPANMFELDGLWTDKYSVLQRTEFSLANDFLQRTLMFQDIQELKIAVSPNKKNGAQYTRVP